VQGTAAVEFAIAALPMLIAIFGALEFARYSWTLNVIEQLAADTARCVGLRQSGCASGGAVSLPSARAFAVGLAADRAVLLVSTAVAIDPAASCGGIPGFSRVEVATRFRAATPLVGALLDKPVVASACFPNQS
jgi:Flp pilus assembly protein TadG